MTEEKTYGFKTRKEAQRALDNARAISLGFCPEIKDMCRNTCVCYQAGSFASYQRGEKDWLPEQEQSAKQWRICQPHCLHVNIAGVITVYPG